MNLKSISKLAIIAVLLSSCALNKKAYNSSKEIAVVSYNSTDKVKNNSSLQARAISDIRLKDTVLTDPAGKVKTEFFEQLNKSFLNKIADEENVIDSKPFKTYAKEFTYEQSTLNKIATLGVGYEAAEGYPVLLPKDKKDIMEAFRYIPKNIDAVMVVGSTLQFAEDVTVSVGRFSSAGLSKQRVQCTLHTYILNRSGKKILNKVFVGKSGGKLGADDNKFTLNELTDQAIQDAYREFNAFMIKKLK